MFSRTAIGGGGTRPSTMARTNSRPDRLAALAAVTAGSCQVIVLVLGSPQSPAASEACTGARESADVIEYLRCGCDRCGPDRRRGGPSGQEDRGDHAGA